MLSIEQTEQDIKRKPQSQHGGGFAGFVSYDKKTCKVPQVTWAFWIVKSACTTVGETCSDSFNSTLGLGLGNTAAIFFPILAVLMFAQLRASAYIPYLYWLTVIFMSICGTIATDGLHDNLGLELWIECIIFSILTLASFGLWYNIEGTLDIHGINTLRREGFYWTAVIFTFALGTAVGDGISEAAGLGYGVTFAIFVAIITFFAITWYLKVIAPIPSFWIVYIMTRPLGASLGDLFASPLNDIPGSYTKSSSNNNGKTGEGNMGLGGPTSRPTSHPTTAPLQGGGAGLGYGYTSVLFLGIIIILTTYMTFTNFDAIAIHIVEHDEGMHKVEVEVEVEVEGEGEGEGNLKGNTVIIAALEEGLKEEIECK